MPFSRSETKDCGVISDAKSRVAGSVNPEILTEGIYERTFCVRCKDDNVVEVWCVILLDRGGAVSRRTKGKTVSLLCGKKVIK